MKTRISTAYKKKLFVEAMKNSLGNVTTSCREVGCSRRFYYRWMQKDPKFVEAIKDIEVRRKDLAEHALFKQILEGDGACIRFYLERKVPGYKEKIQSNVNIKNKAEDIEKIYTIVNPEWKKKKEKSSQKQSEKKM